MDTKRHPLVSVVIPTYNSWDTLKLNLLNLVEQSYPGSDFEVIVVDDGSTDHTRENFVRMDFPLSFRCISKENGGPASARNVGIKKALGEYILFLDADVIPSAHLIKEHLKVHRRFSKAVVQGAVLPHPQTTIPDIVRINRVREEMESSRDRTGKISHFQSNTWNLSVKKRALEIVGMFEERFKRPACEDYELGFRLTKAGLELRYCKEGVAYHYAKVTLAEKLNGQFLRGEAFCMFLRLHPEIVRWDQRYSQSLGKIVSFIPASFEDAQFFYQKLSIAQGLFSRLMKQSPDGEKEREIGEIFSSLYTIAASYCFAEGAYVALMGLQHKKTLLLQRNINPNASLMRIPLIFSGSPRTFIGEQLIHILTRHGFCLHKAFHKEPAIQISFGRMKISLKPNTYSILYLDSRSINSFVRLKELKKEGFGEIDSFKEAWVSKSAEKILVHKYFPHLPVFVFPFPFVSSENRTSGLTFSGKKIITRLYRIYRRIHANVASEAFKQGSNKDQMKLVL